MATNAASGFIISCGFRSEVSTTRLRQTSTDSTASIRKSDDDTVEFPLQSDAGQSPGIISKRNEIQSSTTYNCQEFIDIVVYTGRRSFDFSRAIYIFKLKVVWLRHPVNTVINKT